MIINTNVSIKNYCNSDIRINVFEDEVMYDLGFTDFVEGFWYYTTDLKNIDIPISFNLSINKKTLDYSIDVLDDDILQPVNYQKYIIEAKDIKEINSFYLKIHKQVQEIMKYLTEVNIINNYKENDFI